MSSKSHLASRFKLQIQAQSENSAKTMLENFDTWYQENNLDAMLADRMAAKDQKRVGKERKARVLSGTVRTFDARVLNRS